MHLNSTTIQKCNSLVTLIIKNIGSLSSTSKITKPTIIPCQFRPIIIQVHIKNFKIIQYKSKS
ncbi:hypothetical protein [Methanobrevibacter sp.]|uniref:hypothetical protein n=1 Tax=Methanobrevibacter sp. TaxID=66852 RepID=UPI0026DF01F5|nr:hypothetical protein [Methanobrevibacter sp.]